MTRGRQDAQLEVSVGEGVVVQDAYPCEVDILLGCDQVVRTVPSGERQATGDVVVVDVRLCDRHDGDACPAAAARQARGRAAGR